MRKAVKANLDFYRNVIDEIAIILPDVLEMEALYRKWRLYYHSIGISDKVAHKKASSIVIRDFPNFDEQAMKAGF